MGKSPEECLREATLDKVFEEKLKAEALAKGVKPWELNPWVSGAQIAYCILFAG